MINLLEGRNVVSSWLKSSPLHLNVYSLIYILKGYLILNLRTTQRSTQGTKSHTQTTQEWEGLLELFVHIKEMPR